MTHILFVLHNEDIQSGASRSLMDIISSLARTKKYRITVILPGENENTQKILAKHGIDSYVYSYGHLVQALYQPFFLRLIKKPVYLARHFKEYLSAWEAAKRFRQQGVDLVYSNTSTILFGGYLGRRLNAKMIWHIREFGKKDHRIVFYLGQEYIERFINRNADAVLCVSNAVKQEHAKYIDRSKMIVTYNSYSQDYVLPRETFNLDKPLNILLTGDIKPGKGQLETLQAVALFLKRYPGQAKVHFAGSGKQKNYLDKLNDCVKQNAMEQQTAFHGRIDNMGELRKEMDIGIVASENEAFGRTTIEGMLSMLCMIGRASGGTVEQIKPMETGLLYDGTPEDMAQKIEYLHLHRQEMEKMARQSYAESVELHTKGRCAQIVDDAIQAVLHLE